jgi:hypothetical protein
VSISLDLSQLPFVICKFDGEQTMEEHEAYIHRMDGVHALKKPYVGITWMKKHARSQAHRDRIGRWMKDCEEATRLYCIGAGIISHSAVFRFVLSSIFLFRPMPCPYHVCGRFDEAEKFVRDEAAKRRFLLPAVKKPWPDLEG